MEEVLQRLSRICARRRIGYGKALPGDLDQEFVELAQDYISAGDDEREQIRSEIPDGCRLLLLGFSSRLATLAARSEDRQLLKLALVAHSLEDFRHDERENIIELTLIHHVAEQLGLKAADLFAAAMRISSERAAKHFQRFVDRPDSSKTLASMGWVEISTDDGVEYRGQMRGAKRI